jgi:hypothetical protein
MGVPNVTLVVNDLQIKIQTANSSGQAPLDLSAAGRTMFEENRPAADAGAVPTRRR